MPTFSDNKGRPWIVDINVLAVKRVRRMLDGLDLTDVNSGSPTLLTRLAIDYVLVCDVLYVLCKPQADALNPPLTDEQFGEAMGGEALGKGHAALMGALVDFFQSLNPPRMEIVRILQGMMRLIAAGVALGESKVAAIDLEKFLPNPSGSSSTNAPASSV